MHDSQKVLPVSLGQALRPGLILPVGRTGTLRDGPRPQFSVPALTLRSARHFSLPLALSSALLPALIHLSAWTVVTVLLVLAWYGLVRMRLTGAPGTAVLMLAAATIAGLVWLDYGTLTGRDAGTALAIQMAVLKLLETRHRRDRVFIIVAGFCLLFCGLLFSQSIPAALLCIPALVLLTAEMLEHPGEPAVTAARRLRYACRLIVQAVPFMLAGFLLFPRTEIARWNLPRDAIKTMTGFSATLSPGSVSQLARSGAVALRVQFRGAVPPQSSLYWRGRVLSVFDGVTWYGEDMPEALLPRDAPADQAVFSYTVTLEPHNQPWLFALDVPLAAPAGTLLTEAHTIQALRPVQAVATYEAISAAVSDPSHRLGRMARSRNLQLPYDDNPRSLALASAWRPLQDPMQVVERALDLFRNDFRYTLYPPATGTFGQVDTFLFKTRSGFCEHYAASFVFLMRAAGVPARVVTGYQGGEVDAVSRLVTVRQSHAHAWAEVWTDDRGWVRVDPVSVLPGNRVDRGTPAPPQVASPGAAATRAADNAGPGRANLTDRAAPDSGQSGALGQALGRLSYLWNRYVLSYREIGQQQLLEQVAGRRPEPMQLLAWWVTALLTAAVLLGWWLGRNTHAFRDPVQKAWLEFQEKCAVAGCGSAPWEGPYDFSERCIRRFPLQSAEIRAIRDTYIALRYAAACQTVPAREFAARVRRFRPD